MKRLMPLVRIIITLIISYFLFVGKFDFTNLQAYGLIFLLVIVIVIIGWNNYAENSTKRNFKPHYINIEFNMEEILHEIGLSEQKIKKFNEVWGKLKKGEIIKNEKLRPNGCKSDRILKLETSRTLSTTLKLTEFNKGLHYSHSAGLDYFVINLLDSGNYLMVDNLVKNIGGAFTTNISCHGRIDIIEGMPYTHIYICHSNTGEGYELGAINLDTKQYSVMGGDWKTEVFYHKERCKIFGIIPYAIIHHQWHTQKQLRKAYKILQKYDCAWETSEYISSIYKKCFNVHYGLIND